MHALAPLDPNTLLVGNVSSVLLIAVTLLAVMGRDPGAGAGFARRALVVQALGWIGLLVSNIWLERYVFNRAVASLALACFAASNWYLFRALEAWLGPRPGRTALLAVSVLMPLGYAALFADYPWRVGWSNFLLAVQFALLLRATLFPAVRRVGRWRWALMLCMLVMTVLSCGRAVLGGFFWAQYPHFMVPHPFNLAYLLLANPVLILINVSLLVAWREEAEQQLRDQAITDPLTGVLNRRGWNEGSARVFAHARRHRQALALLLIDLDHFKRINDTRGHDAGDEALRVFGSILCRERRVGDVVARVGGEEFHVLMPLTDAAAARAFDKRLRTTLAAFASTRLGFALDFSTGLSCLVADDADLAALVQRADRALYAAKASGRGRLLGA